MSNRTVLRTAESATSKNFMAKKMFKLGLSVVKTFTAQLLDERNKMLEVNGSISFFCRYMIMFALKTISEMHNERAIAWSFYDLTDRALILFVSNR